MGKSIEITNYRDALEFLNHLYLCFKFDPNSNNLLLKNLNDSINVIKEKIEILEFENAGNKIAMMPGGEKYENV